MTDTMLVFDRAAKRRQRRRAAAIPGDHDFLRDAVAERLLDRLDDIKRSFPTALVQGCDSAWLRPRLGARGGIETLVSLDAVPSTGPLHVYGDEEFLPFAADPFALVIATLTLPWLETTNARR